MTTTKRPHYEPDPDNINCLAGWVCPKCGNTKVFWVAALSTFELTDDGAEQTGDVEYSGKSFARCRCGHADTVATFRRSR